MDLQDSDSRGNRGRTARRDGRVKWVKQECRAHPGLMGRKAARAKRENTGSQGTLESQVWEYLGHRERMESLGFQGYRGNEASQVQLDLQVKRAQRPNPVCVFQPNKENGGRRVIR